MKQMKTIKFPNDAETYEIVDESARNRIIALEEDGGSGSLQLTSKPTTETVGEVGQFAVDTSTKKTYICVSAVDGVYTWERVPTYKTMLVQELITSTCDWTVPQVEGPVHVRLFGGGGGCSTNDEGTNGYTRSAGGGGGHMTIAGAQLADTTVDEVTKLLKTAIDEYFE